MNPNPFNVQSAQHTPPLHAEGLQYCWGQQVAIDGLGLQVGKGELFGLLGPNGAGKTTFISLIAGLIKPKAGHLLIQGFNPAQQPIAARRATGFVFQSLSLDRLMTVQQNLRFAAGLQGLNAAHTEQRLATLAEEFSLAPLMHRPVASLSGGQQRLVDMARALVHSPSLLILDEPTTALDVPSKNTVWSTLQSLREKHGLSIIVATHLMDEALACDTVCFLYKGKSHWQGSPQEALAELSQQHASTGKPGSLTDWFLWKLQHLTTPAP